MKFTKWSGFDSDELLNCPFCGDDPEVRHIGNNYSKKRKIQVRCPTCRIERTDASFREDFEWLERIVTKNWNQRTL